MANGFSVTKYKSQRQLQFPGLGENARGGALCTCSGAPPPGGVEGGESETASRPRTKLPRGPPRDPTSGGGVLLAHAVVRLVEPVAAAPAAPLRLPPPPPAQAQGAPLGLRLGPLLALGAALQEVAVPPHGCLPGGRGTPQRDPPAPPTPPDAPSSSSSSPGMAGSARLEEEEEEEAGGQRRPARDAPSTSPRGRAAPTAPQEQARQAGGGGPGSSALSVEPARCAPLQVPSRRCAARLPWRAVPQAGGDSEAPGERPDE
ncbi:PREDICTED: dual specificity protein phosphatase 8-like [Gekko japonicus]|uniref:Dual specificity protein phosphatase 8-like n=1 Tax=Gekko japonicus TaxID=146911 RepID=A0ABM1JTP4_GEKJA|nr:PREDICTED: dual specificity protein phosphatase 8-like [Gekko japonicus]